MNIANELKNYGVIRLPNLYDNPELLRHLYELLYVKEGYEDIAYSFIPAKRRYIKDVYKNKQNFYIFIRDLHDLDMNLLESNSYVCVVHLSKNQIRKQTKNYESEFTEYKISLKTLKIILFKISITDTHLSHLINEEFLKGNIKPVKVHTYNKYRRNPCNKNK